MNTRAQWVSSLSLRSSTNGRREAHNALLQLVKCNQRHVHTGEQTGCGSVANSILYNVYTVLNERTVLDVRHRFICL